MTRCTINPLIITLIHMNEDFLELVPISVQHIGELWFSES